MMETAKRLSRLIDITVTKIYDKIPNVWINGDIDNGLPGIVNIGLNGISGESLMNILDLKGIYVSTSSACNSGKDEPSHVLLALGQTEDQAKSAIRISYGRFNTEENAVMLSNTICDTYNKIIEASGRDTISSSQ